MKSPFYLLVGSLLTLNDALLWLEAAEKRNCDRKTRDTPHVLDDVLPTNNKRRRSLLAPLLFPFVFTSSGSCLEIEEPLECKDGAIIPGRQSFAVMPLCA